MAGTIYRTYPGTLNERETITGDANVAIPPNAGFMPIADGTVSIRLRNEPAKITLPVLAGHFYPFDVVEYNQTASTTATTIYVFRGAAY